MDLSRKFQSGGRRVLVVYSEKCLAAVFNSDRQKVLLGSREHREALRVRIAELEHLQRASRTGEDKSQKLRDELVRLTAELQFLEQNKLESLDFPVAVGSVDALHTLDDLEAIGTSEAFGIEHSETVFSESSDDTVETIHATTETFGQLSKIRFIQVVEQHQRVLSRPKIRQYFAQDVLHREEHERRVGWYELFVDLIFVGATSKAGHLIAVDYTFYSFLTFIIAFGGLFRQWVTFTLYNNQFHHHDIVEKAFYFVMISGVVVMAVSISHAFDVNPVTNSASMFIGASIFSQIVYAVMLTLNAYFIPHMARAIFAGSWTTVVSNVVLLIPLLCLPETGDSERHSFRMIYWGIITLIGFLQPLLGMIPVASMSYRIAVNIEHMTERYGLLVVIVIGEIVVGFLFDHQSSDFTSEIGLVVTSFLIASNLFQLYFRAETSPKHLHAIRRNRYTGMLWSLIHFPLACAIVCVGSSLNGMIAIQEYSNKYVSKAAADYSSLPGLGKKQGEMTYEFQVLFATCVAIVHFSLSALQLMHLEAKHRHSVANISRNKRIAGRVFAGFVILILGFTAQLKASSWIILVACFTTFGVVFEEFGGIHKYLKSKQQRKQMHEAESGKP